MARFQILSLIGGGIRGAFVTSYLHTLEKKLGRPIAECFDLIAGTSTGGIIAAGLACGMSAAELRQFYEDYGAKIFSPREPYRAKGVWRFIYPLANLVFKAKTGGQLDAAFRARFCPFALEEAFCKGFGEKTLGEVRCTRLIMPSVNLSQGRPHIFRSLHLPRAVPDKDVPITDAIIATTAAPTYFPHRQIRDDVFVDGGMWAADPSLLAIAEAIRIQQFEKRLEADARIETNEIHLLSIGTGWAQFSLSPPGADAGLLYWSSRVADVMMTSQVLGVHQPLKFILGDRYRHINFKMTERWGLDQVSYLPELFEMGERRAEETFETVRNEFLEHNYTCFVPFHSNEHELAVEDDFGFGGEPKWSA